MACYTICIHFTDGGDPYIRQNMDILTFEEEKESWRREYDLEISGIIGTTFYYTAYPKIGWMF